MGPRLFQRKRRHVCIMLGYLKTKHGILCVCVIACLCVFWLIWRSSSMLAICLHLPREARERMATYSQRKEYVNNMGATVYLAQYKAAYNKNKVTPVVQPDPNMPETITTWWQAAAMIDWYIHSPIRHHCSNIVSIGNWHICQDKPYRVKHPCLVYSFGINFNFSFDDAMAKLGCEVHSFDPSMNQTDHKRRDSSTFHNLGLGGANTDGFVPRQDEYVKGRSVWKIRTVKSIMKMLGHENRVIDVFKMDIEAYEWAVLDNMMETDVLKHVRQLALEYHLFHDFPIVEEYIHFYKTVTRLREFGFREYSSGSKQSNRNLSANQGYVKYVNAFFGKETDWE